MFFWNKVEINFPFCTKFFNSWCSIYFARHLIFFYRPHKITSADLLLQDCKLLVHSHNNIFSYLLIILNSIYSLILPRDPISKLHSCIIYTIISPKIFISIFNNYFILSQRPLSPNFLQSLWTMLFIKSPVQYRPSQKWYSFPEEKNQLYISTPILLFPSLFFS